MALENLSNYLKIYKELLAGQDAKQFPKKIKIAVLASSTINGLKECLFVKAHSLKVAAEIYMGGYNQYNQEILNDKSELYEFNPDIVFLFIDMRELLGNAFFSFYELTEQEKAELFKSKLDNLRALVSKLSKKLGGKIVLHNFEVPLESPLGLIDNKQTLGFIDFVKKLNFELAQSLRENSQIFVFDYELFCSRWGKENIFDYKIYYLGDIKLRLEFLPALCDEYISYIKPLLGLNKKCIVLDLDNSLWGGIIGEDGIDGIKLDQAPQGRPFLEFQKYLLSLFHRGIILAINSKNNPEDALDVLRKHPNMILKEEHFASIRINWGDKISNMKAIAEELNIGLDSLVYFDDDKSNREMIRTALPEVAVVDLPEDPALYLKTIMDLDDFGSFYLSEEDRKKGQIYTDQRKRQELATSVTDITEYLKALEMVVTLEKANSFTISRVAQLTQKTNQFNITTRRYSEEQIKSFAADKNYLVFSAKVEDKFGDNGITGVGIIKKEKDNWLIDTFLLSCRIIGRDIEKVMLAYIAEMAEQENATSLHGEFIRTEKNAPAKDFYKNSNFKLLEETDTYQKWSLPLKDKPLYPEFIKVIKK